MHKKNFGGGIFFIALIIRLIPVLLSYNLSIGLDDMFQYDMLARSIVSGNGYRWYAEDDFYLAQQLIDFETEGIELDPNGILTSFRAPLYPTFLALIYFFSGVGVWRFLIVRLVQTVLGAILSPLTYLLALSFFPEKEKLARISAWMVTLYPMLIIFPLALATENLFFPFFLGTILCLLKAVEERKAGLFVLTGFLMGATALTRSVILIVALASVVWLWFSIRERKFATIMLMTMLMVISPWIMRNSLLHKKLTGIETSLGYNLYLGYHPQNTGTFKVGISLDLLPILDDGERNQAGMDAAKKFILDDPGRVPYLLIRKLGHFFDLERRAVSYFYSNNFLGFIPLIPLTIIAFVLTMPFIIISVSAILGAAIIRWNRKRAFLALIIIGYIIPHILIMSEERFHLSLIPFFSILAAYFWKKGSFSAIKKRCGTPSGRKAISMAIGAILLLFLNWGLALWRDADKLMLLFGANGNQAHFPY